MFDCCNLFECKNIIEPAVKCLDRKREVQKKKYQIIIGY